MAVAGGAALAVALACSIASLFVRFRRARSAERQQLKWLDLRGVCSSASRWRLVFLIEALVVQEALAITNTS